jgi:SnoaL-like protein
MSEENAAGRTIVERAGLRWPSMLPRTTQSILRLPQGSRLRRAMLRRMARVAFESWNRGDFALVPYVDHPQVETHFSQGSSGHLIDLDTVYYGPEGHCRAMETWNEAWSKWDADIENVIEEGRDRFVVFGRVHAEGAGSGVKLDEWGAVRYTFGEGRIVRIDAAFGFDRDRVLDALSVDATAEAAGLSE